MLDPDTNPTPHSVRKTRATTTLRRRVTSQTPHGRLTPLSDTSRWSAEGPGASLDERGTRRWRRTARGYLLLPHLAPVLVVELATAAFAVIAWGGLPPPHLLGLLLLAMLGGQLAIGATNELVDLPDDAVGKPWKPIPSGDVSIRGAQAMLALGLIMMVVLGSRFGTLPFALLALGTGLGIAYDLWFKRTIWSWLPYLLALPLLPIWVFASLGKPELRLLLLYPLGALATVGVHLAQALPDVTIDREAGLETVTSRLGEMRIFVFAWLATLSAPVLGWFAAQWLGASQQSVPIAVASGLAVLLLAINVILIRADRRRGAIACFPLVALTTLVTGLAWTAIVVR
ncbi:MAG: UbiA prenyltransferase [Thermomicrobiales bacterium]|nr:UbiA prenyltransferase [Thermomicrobiales bacterium]